MLLSFFNTVFSIWLFMIKPFCRLYQLRLTVDGSFKVMWDTWEKDVFKFNLQLLFFLLLHEGNIDEEIDLHLGVHKVDIAQHAVDVFVSEPKLWLKWIVLIYLGTVYSWPRGEGIIEEFLVHEGDCPRIRVVDLLQIVVEGYSHLRLRFCQVLSLALALFSLRSNHRKIKFLDILYW